jgi:hypothetical protein
VVASALWTPPERARAEPRRARTLAGKPAVAARPIRFFTARRGAACRCASRTRAAPRAAWQRCACRRGGASARDANFARDGALYPLPPRAHFSLSAAAACGAALLRSLARSRARARTRRMLMAPNSSTLGACGHCLNCTNSAHFGAPRADAVPAALLPRRPDLPPHAECRTASCRRWRNVMPRRAAARGRAHPTRRVREQRHPRVDAPRVDAPRVPRTSHLFFSAKALALCGA